MDTPPAPPPQAEKSSRWIAAVAVVIVFLLLGELWRRIGQASQLGQLERRLDVQVTALSSESAALATEIAQARSDEAVARWARSEAKMALPGEVLVQPVTPASAAPATAAEDALPPAPPNWRIWWEWLWGEG
jgi:cell division protein FtsB